MFTELAKPRHDPEVQTAGKPGWLHEPELSDMWQPLPPSLKSWLIMWSCVAAISLIGLDVAGVAWFLRAPLVADWGRIGLSWGFALLALTAGYQAGAIFNAACGWRAFVASAISLEKCPICNGSAFPLTEDINDYVLCDHCQRAWMRNGREVDWP